MAMVMQAVLGPAPVNPLVATLQQAGTAGQFSAVAEHCLASGVLGPFWEEVSLSKIGSQLGCGTVLGGAITALIVADNGIGTTGAGHQNLLTGHHAC